MQRLRSVGIGRVAVSSRAMPMILPVRFHLTGDETLVFYARAGTTLHRCTDTAVVAFEAEGPAGAAEPTWSVLAHGLARQSPPSWPSTEASQAVRIELEVSEVTGRENCDPSNPMAPLMAGALPHW